MRRFMRGWQLVVVLIVLCEGLSGVFFTPTAWAAPNGTTPGAFPTVSLPGSPCTRNHYIQREDIASAISTFAVSCTHLWGADSFEHITQALYESVTSKYGTPDFWGRYIGNDSKHYPKDINLSEVTFAHNNGLAILPVYFNYTSNAVKKYGVGQKYATAAIADAQQRLSIPRGVAIFNDIEEGQSVNPDAAFIQGWYDQFNRTFAYTYQKQRFTYQAGYYKAGYYANGTDSRKPGNGKYTSRFAIAYCKAVSIEARIGTNSFIWSSQPGGSRTSKTNAPPYGPYTPDCINQTSAWQYAIQPAPKKGQKRVPPDVDTDEALVSLPLWQP